MRWCVFWLGSPVFLRPSSITLWLVITVDGGVNERYSSFELRLVSVEVVS